MKIDINKSSGEVFLKVYHNRLIMYLKIDKSQTDFETNVVVVSSKISKFQTP